MVQHAHQRLGKRQQRHRTRHGQQHHQAQPPVQHRRIRLRIARGLGTRQLRHQHHPQRHAQHGGRKLHQAVRIAQPAHAARRQVRGNLRVDQQRDLRHAHAQNGRQHQLGNAARMRIGQRLAHGRHTHADAREHAQPVQRPQLRAQLQHATHHHAHAQRVDGMDAHAAEPGSAQPGCGDHRNVEQHWRRRRHRVALPGIQYSGRQRHQRHETDIGKDPARHHHGGLETFRVLLQAAGHQPHQQRRKQHAQHAEHHQHPEQHRGHTVDHAVGGSVPLLLARGGQHRHKGLAEGALGKQPAEQVGNAECHVEGIGEGAGTKGRGDQQFADQAGDAGGQRQQRDGGGRLEQAHDGTGRCGAAMGGSSPQKSAPRARSCGESLEPPPLARGT